MPTLIFKNPVNLLAHCICPEWDMPALLLFHRIMHRIANALEGIADYQELLLSCREEQLDVLKDLNHEFRRHGLGL